MPINDSDLLEGFEIETVAPVSPDPSIWSPETGLKVRIPKSVNDSDLLEGFEGVSEPVPKVKTEPVLEPVPKVETEVKTKVETDLPTKARTFVEQITDLYTKISSKREDKKSLYRFPYEEHMAKA